MMRGGERGKGEGEMGMNSGREGKRKARNQNIY